MTEYSRRWLGTARIWGCMLSAASGFACDHSAAEPAAELRVFTDKVALTSDVAARPTLVNVGPGDVHAPMNEYVYVERFDGEHWRDRQPWFSVDGFGISFPLRAGDSLSAPPMNFAYVGR